ncbi:unnamed protein product [Prorocentrum cordatum]|uniref:Nucleotide-diphospho-sugar transferase domain-containing protein n=1 Tax=Prorocentrum cordatum TaxID=2364126 RepID=A0ABN9Y3R6_9DINO|nr:unnamed protein product [Polarella glacialis]
MSVVLVFTDAGHLALFQATVANISAGVVGAMNSLWTAVVAYALPDFLSKMTDATSRNMKTAAYKKWFGIAYLLDNEPHAPAYGLMLDADLRLFNTSDCSLSGRWSRLLSRIERSEARKEWLGIPHANMTRSDTREGAWAMSMQRRVLRVNAVWVVGGGATFDRHCVTEQCQRLRWQVDNVFFTWWTDLPYVNLRVASRMLVFLGGGRAKLETANCSFQSLSRSLEYTPFEHLAYQQWCVLHEGFAFRDMSDVVTSTANWGSFMEGPAAGARLVDLRPGWVSARALAMAQDGEIPDLSPAEPLLLFHIDRQAKDVIVPTRTEMQRRGVSINL